MIENGKPPPDLTVTFQPAPVRVIVSQHHTPQGNRVLLQMFTATGVFGILVSPDEAAEIAKQVEAIAVRARSGLITPP